MRTRKELIYLNIKDITDEERNALGDMGLNCCDICGEIEQSEKLLWIDQEGFYDDKRAQELVKKGHVAVCEDCYKDKLVKKKFPNE